MILSLKTPKEVQEHNFQFKSYEDIPEAVFAEISARFKALQSDKPLVSVNIIAWNEEESILCNLSSLSKLKTTFPIEIVYVDNNSKDHTSDIIRKCGLTPILETQQGYGFARQAALNNSKGKYIITGDSDTIYLPNWVEIMVQPLLKNKAIATFGTYAFLPADGVDRSGFVFYEMMRFTLHKIRSINRPELIVGGVNFCFPRDLALKIGFIKTDERMEDGQMAGNLKKHGKLLRITHPQTIAWTIPRRMQESGSQLAAIWLRLKKEARQFHLYFSKKPLK
ncbi:MAG: glycosyltransferase family 2 protein [Bacteroidales bacterium]